MKLEISTTTNKTQMLISEYFENLYTRKLENLNEMDKLLDTCNQSKLLNT
jgi:hypothetical protein